MESRTQRAQSFQRGIGTRTLINLESDFHPLRLGAVRSGETHRHWNDLVFEFSALDRCQSFLVAVKRKLVGFLTGNAKSLRQPFRRKPHREIGVWIISNQPWIR